MSFAKFYNKIFDYSLKKGTHIKFIDMLSVITMKEQQIKYLTKHIHKELPIRLSNRVTDLNNLPFGLSKNHSINQIREWYLDSFLDVVDVKEPSTENEHLEYKNKIEKIYNRHSTTLMTISKGIYELKRDNKISDIEAPTIQTFLNRFYTNRTEIRILLEHYLSLYKNKNDNYLGIINMSTEPNNVIKDVIENLQTICSEDLSDIINIDSDKNYKISTINHYLYYVLFELIKNSIQAVREKKNIDYNNRYKGMINVSIKEIDENWIVIKIKDNGIGIKQCNMNKIWYYSFSTTPINYNDISENNDFDTLSPLSGFGYGMPISDIYINFLNSTPNNIKIESTYGKGTTLYLYLRNYNFSL
jgi:pyruvate dehydrogenase kinase 2/3/4